MVKLLIQSFRIIAAVILLNSVANAQVAYDNATAATFNSTSVTFSHAVGSSSNRVLYVCASSDAGSGGLFTSATYNGVSMVELFDAAPAPAFFPIALYRLIAPPTGNFSVVVNLSATVNGVAAAISYSNVNQFSPDDGIDVLPQVGTQPSNTVVSQTGDLVADCISAIANAPITPGAGQTERIDQSWAVGNIARLGLSHEAGAASVTMSWTTPVDDTWISLAWSLNAFSTAPTLNGDFNSGTGTSVSVTHTITAGRGQFALITTSEDVTCSAPGGWTNGQSVSIFGTQRYCNFFILSATGSETTNFTISASANWVISIWEASVPFVSLVASIATAENSDPISTDPLVANAGNFVIAGMGNEAAFVPAISPTGFTNPIPKGAGQTHYGANGVMMGSLAYSVAASSGSIDPIWDIDQPVFSGIGLHIFELAGSNSRGRNLSLLGVQ